MYVGGRSRDDNAVCRELRELAGPVDFDDYVVDLCFMTYTTGGLGLESPDMPGRFTQTVTTCDHPLGGSVHRNALIRSVMHVNRPDLWRSRCGRRSGVSFQPSLTSGVLRLLSDPR
jgi:hypothetical protein